MSIIIFSSRRLVPSLYCSLPTMRNFHFCIFKLLKDLLIYNIVNSSIKNTIDFNVTEYGRIFNTDYRKNE